MSADGWRVRHPGIGALDYDSEAEARVAAGTAGEVLPPDLTTAERSDPEESAVAGQARILDESPWRVGRSGSGVYRQAGPAPDWFGDDLIGRMETPDLAAQVVAEHEHARQFRAMLDGVEQRAVERDPNAPCDNDALAARLGYVPQPRLAEVEAGRNRLLQRYVAEHEAHTSTMFERDQLREASARAGGWVPLTEVLDALQGEARRLDERLLPGVGDGLDLAAKFLAERFPTPPPGP